jgi:hypothetical protein
MTNQDIFNITVDLISERLDSGQVDTTNTLNYSKRAPGLLTMLNSEICREAPLYKSLTITEVTQTANDYTEITLPADYIAMYQLLDSNLNLVDDFKIIGRKLYVRYDLNGTLIYRYVPAVVTALSETTPYDNMIATTVIPNALAAQLLINENTTLANYFNQRYIELLNKIKTKEPASINKRTDKYDASCKF